ncbi:MAG: undecaprenyldiphospho-muramoylpentapeptide beta-N-acetylglucosaminyltransferase [Muribaculaceae bacterium]|nr:undecaprenyldiphospho-muramoylpentapeptide beta-N-acetylglucosaminyltransferase [Muribaculaceae bacterium]
MHNDNKTTTATRRPERVLISGGGTGGHIFPALSIADALKREYPDCEILFVGAENRMEMQRVPAAGYKIEGLPVSGFDRRHLWRNVGVAIKLFRSMRKAHKIVRTFRPDVAIGVGGYASGPTLKAAQKMGVPTVLQEQNSYAGVTNKLLAAKAERICVAYPDMDKFFPADKIVMTGNPVRKKLLEPGMTKAEAKERCGFDPSKPLVLFIGGSLGARTLNNTMIGAINSGAASQAPFQVMWQCGASDGSRCAEAVAGKMPASVILTEFIADMSAAYCAADLVVSRAGAGTISELELLGKPSILVPSPNVAEDHQRHNAQALAERGAAGMVLDVDAESQLWREVCVVMDNDQTLRLLSENISKMALRDSDSKIVDAIVEVIQNNPKH